MMKISPNKTYTFFFVALSLISCSLHKVREEPELIGFNPKKPFSQSALANHSNEIKDSNSNPWWLDLESPKLTQLIESSLKSSLDIKKQLHAYKKSIAIYNQASAVPWPELSLVGRRQRAIQAGVATNNWGIGGEISWELDLFNKLGEEARYSALMTKAEEHKLQATKLSLTAGLAQRYFQCLNFHKQKELLEKQISAEQERLSLFQVRFKSGIIPVVDVLQQELQLTEIESQLPATEANILQCELDIDVLTGKQPDNQFLLSPMDSFAKLGAIPAVSMPSQLLLRRPDLAAILNELYALDARIAKAIANRLPQISLTASSFWQVADGNGANIQNLVANLIQPIFDWGLRKWQVEESRELYRIKLMDLNKALLVALNEIESNFFRQQKEQELLVTLEKKESLLRRTLKETRARYNAGITDYLPVLNAQQEMNRVQRLVINQRMNILVLRIEFYKLIGGSLGEKSEKT